MTNRFAPGFLLGLLLSSSALAQSTSVPAGNGADIQAMAADVGAAIHAANAGALIIVEGPVNSNSTMFSGVPNTTVKTMDLTKAGTNPVGITAKTVYSVHDFPAHIGGQTPDNGSTKVGMMNSAWGFLVKNNTAPVLVVLGANLDNTDTYGTADSTWLATTGPYLNGSSGIAGGPTFTGTDQAIPTSWSTFGNLTGTPNGICSDAACDAYRSGQQTAFVSLFSTTPTVPTGGTVWNPNDKTSSIVLSGGNTVAASVGAVRQGVRTTTSKSSGKACIEAILTNVTENITIGPATSGESLVGYLGGGGSTGLGLYTQYSPGQQVYGNGAVLNQGSAISASGVKVIMALNLDTQKYWVQTDQMVAASQPWDNSASDNPATGAGGMSISFMGPAGTSVFIEANSQDDASKWTLVPTPATGCPTGFPPWDAGSTAIKRPMITILGE